MTRWRRSRAGLLVALGEDLEQQLGAPAVEFYVSEFVTSNKPFGLWGEVFGDDVAAAAMIDRLVHNSESRPRPRGRNHRRLTIKPASQGVKIQPPGVKIRASLTMATIS